jgi:hypothetical protein
MILLIKALLSESPITTDYTDFTDESFIASIMLLSVFII